MQQRQPRLGDILDDYCPRERRLTNHVVVAMIGEEVKQTRCSTCDADHEYKHARVPRPRRKSEPAALYSQVLAGITPKKVVHDSSAMAEPEPQPQEEGTASDGDLLVGVDGSAEPLSHDLDGAEALAGDANVGEAEEEREPAGEGPVHRTLIRAQLPRSEGQPPPARPAPDFTIRQPSGRQNRFRPRQPRGGQPFQGNRSNGNVAGGGDMRGGFPRQFGGRPPGTSRPSQHQAPGRKRSK